MTASDCCFYTSEMSPLNTHIYFFKKDLSQLKIFQKHILCKIEIDFIESLTSLQIIESLKIKKNWYIILYTIWLYVHQKISLENKSPWVYFPCFTVLGAPPIADKNLWKNYFITIRLKAKLNLVLIWFCFLIIWFAFNIILLIGAN